MFSGVGKQMVNAEFSRIYRFVKLLLNEGFLAVIQSSQLFLVIPVLLVIPSNASHPSHLSRASHPIPQPSQSSLVIPVVLCHANHPSHL